MGIVMSVIGAVQQQIVRVTRGGSRLLLGRSPSVVEKQIEEKLVNRAKEHPSKMKSLNTLLMKFSILEEGFEQCRDTFVRIDTEKTGTLSYEELRAAAQDLGYLGTENDLELIFQHSDIDGGNNLTFREFLVTLMFLNVLEDTHKTPLDQVQKAFDIAIEAFLFFDKEGTGFLNKREVMDAAYESKEGIPESMKKRFEEMDADHSGIVTLAEFMYALSTWAGVEDNVEPETNEMEAELNAHLLTASENSRKSFDAGHFPSTEGLLERQPSAVEKKIEEKLVERAKTHPSKMKSLNSLLLKLRTLEIGFDKCRSAFVNYGNADSGTISSSSLPKAATSLGYLGSEEDLKLIYDHAQMSGEETFSFKEFLITLMYLNVLEDSHVAETDDVQHAFEVVIEAFLFFDKGGTGFLDKSEVMQAAYEAKEGIPDSMKKRFEEMDASHSGIVTLAQFTATISEWADVEDMD